MRPRRDSAPVDLSVNLGPLRLKNPVVAASGTFGYGTEFTPYLNLSHIWGEARFATCNDSDNIDDTPNQFDKNYGKPTFPHVSCNNAPDGDMFMNYMDYVDDSAMFMFTIEQALRMGATLAGPRADLGF